MLVAKGLLTQQALDAVLETQKSQGRQKLLGELLVEQGLLTEEQLCEALADVYGRCRTRRCHRRSAIRK